MINLSDKYGPNMPTKRIRVFPRPQISGNKYSETNTDKYVPSMPTKTFRVFSRSWISGGEYSETNLNYYGPTMPTKTIRVFSRFQISGGEYFKTNNSIAIDMRPMPKPNISLPIIIMLWWNAYIVIIKPAKKKQLAANIDCLPPILCTKVRPKISAIPVIVIVMFELTEATWVKSYPTNSEIFGFNLVTVLNPAV